MLALSSGSAGLSPTFVFIVIAAVVLVLFWQTLLRIGIAVMVIGFVFVLVSGLLAVLHTLHGLVH